MGSRASPHSKTVSVSAACSHCKPTQAPFPSQPLKPHQDGTAPAHTARGIYSFNRCVEGGVASVASTKTQQASKHAGGTKKQASSKSRASPRPSSTPLTQAHKPPRCLITFCRHHKDTSGTKLPTKHTALYQHTPRRASNIEPLKRSAAGRGGRCGTAYADW